MEKQLNEARLANKGRNGNPGKRFVFRKFAQRVASVNIDIHHSLTGDRADEREISGSALDGVPLASTTLERWVELNCTAQFAAFQKEVRPMLLSVPLMLHKRDELFSALRRHLAVASAIALKPMLEVTAAVAADLRQEFYSEFPPLLATLAGLLSPKDVEMLEDVFSTLCYLFKYLMRQLLADLPAAFDAYRPLLAHEKSHVREFAAESFAYLLRRLPASKLPIAFTQALLPHVGAHGAALDSGIAHLLFRTTAGLGNAFHSRTPALLNATLPLLGPKAAAIASSGGDASSSNGITSADAMLVVMKEALHLMSEHTRQPHAEPVWSTLLQELGTAFDVWSRRLARGGDKFDSASTQLCSLVALVRSWVLERRGSRIPAGGRPALVKLLSGYVPRDVLFLAAKSHRADVIDEVLKTLASALLANGAPVEEAAILLQIKPTVEAVFACEQAKDGGNTSLVCGLAALRFGLSLACWRHFSNIVLEPMMSACEACASTQQGSAIKALFALVHAAPEATLILPGSGQGACALALCDAIEAPSAPAGLGEAGLRLCLGALRVIQSAARTSIDACNSRLSTAVESMLRADTAELVEQGYTPRSALLTHSVATETLVALSTSKARGSGAPSAVMLPAVLEKLLYQDTATDWDGGWSSPALLRASAAFIAAVDVPQQKKAEKELFGQVLVQLIRALSHDATEVRVAAIEMLESLHRRGWLLPPSKRGAEPDSSSNAIVFRLFELGRAIEGAPSAPTSKQLAFDAEALIKVARQSKLPALAAELLANHAVGMLRIKFAHVWHHARELLQALTQNWPDLVGRVVLDGLARAVGHSLAPRLAFPAGVSATASDSKEEPAEKEEMGDEHLGEEEAEDDEADDDELEDSRSEMEDTLDTLDKVWEEAMQAPAMGTEPAHCASQLLEALAALPLLRIVTRHSKSFSSLWRATMDASTPDMDNDEDDDAPLVSSVGNELRDARCSSDFSRCSRPRTRRPGSKGRTSCMLIARGSSGIRITAFRMLLSRSSLNGRSPG
jgi:hypothetical protein